MARSISGVQPGARLLLHAEGEQSVRAVLARIDAIGRWASRLSASRPRTGARSPTGSQRTCRCPNTRRAARRLAGREGRCHDRSFHFRHRAAPSLARARSPRAGGPVRLRPRCAGLGVLRASAATPDLQPVRQRGGRLVSHRSARPSHQLATTSVVGRQHRAGAAACRAAALAAQRGYLPTRIPLLKRVGAVAPQEVCIADGKVRIDGVPSAAVLSADRWGRPLPSRQQCHRLRHGELFLLSVTNPASFDSRYFGPVSAASVIGVARPVWLESRP